ncbi:HepT-like ribonuclease domain-containing protein [Fumia xinanensis]|uniref:DUF86 domain-containing protein n=1 Tax=Fumia xinanensis TaxID=2763659 RepID=A0A926I7A6_9FIRM|nr:HepT-like ribonuclease domain-containing protein [Fumia xinanensis]MBC8560775.1 DUF86 domain-containing protein [Fumia xinanensis]
MRNSPQANIDILNRILKYCENIEKLIERFGKDYTIFQNDLAYKDAISMNILQIGELSGHLSEEYRIATKDRMPWKSIKSMRNFFAHSYGQMDLSVIWSTAVEDIPKLKAFCFEEIQTNRLLNDDSIAFSEEDDEDLEI